MRGFTICLAFALAGAVTSRVDAQWLEEKAPHYSVFYQPESQSDLAFIQKWLDNAEALMKSKYGVIPDKYFLTFYLYPTSNDAVDLQTALDRCCGTAVQGITPESIRHLAPSASYWRGPDAKTSLGLPMDENYHAILTMTEYMPTGYLAVQDAPGTGWRYYSAPEWFIQGLPAYDGIFHTTDVNRDVTRTKLLEWAKSNADKFTCCSPDLAIADAANGGAAFMTFLASQFGEGIHARLLRSKAPTFSRALALETKLTIPKLYESFRAWVANPTSDQPPPPPTPAKPATSAPPRRPAQPAKPRPAPKPGTAGR